MKFRKKPVVIDAVQWTGKNMEDIIAFCNKPGSHHLAGTETYDGTEFLMIKTLEGMMRAAPGSWVIRGVAGEYYPCMPDIFEKTYEVV